MNFFDKYFVFSSSEKRGIYLFLLIIFLLCLIYWLMPKILRPDPTDFTKIKAQLQQNSTNNKIKENENVLFNFNPNTITVDSLQLLGFTSKQAWNTINFRKKVKEFETKEELKKLYAMTDSLYLTIEPYILLAENKYPPKTKEEKGVDVEQSLFVFNPNTVSKDSLLLLGFKEKTAETFIKFRKATEGFKTKEELKKVFGISEEFYSEIETYIQIPIQKSEKISQEKATRININTSSKEELMKARGIGPAFSNRIVEYREKLGGFLNINQLEEVYGIDKEWINKYGYQFFYNPNHINKIKINSIEFKALLKHPYFSYSEVKRIISYRDMHGKFSTLEQIRDNNLINPEQYRKIVPYLSLE